MSNANFGADATSISAPRGAGAQVIQGVETPPSNPNLAPLETAVGAITNLFKGKAEQWGEEASNNRLRGILSQGDRLTQAVKTARTSGQRDTARMNLEMFWDEAINNNADLVEPLRKVKDLKEKYGFTGRVSRELSTEDEQRNKLIGQMQSEGIPVSLGDPPEIVNASIDAYQKSLNARKVLQDQVTSRQALDTLEASDRSKEERRLKKEAETVLLEVGNANFGTLDVMLQDILRRKASNMPVMEQVNALEQRISTIGGATFSASRYAPELASSMQSRMQGYLEMVKNLRDPNTDVEALTRDINKRVAQSTIAMMNKDPSMAKVMAASRINANSPFVLQSVDTWAQRHLMENGTYAAGEGSGGDGVNPRRERVFGFPDREKDVLTAIPALVKSAGENPGDKRMHQEVRGNIATIIEEFADPILSGKASQQQVDNFLNLFADPGVSRFVRENPLGSDTISKLDKVYQNQYTAVFQNSLQKTLFNEIQKRDPNSVWLADLILGKDSTKKGVIKDLITVEHNGNSLVIRPKDPTDFLGVEASQMFDKMSQRASKIVNIGAAIQGVSPEAYWRRNRAAFLPGMGYKVEGEPTTDVPAEEAKKARERELAGRKRQDVLDMTSQIAAPPPTNGVAAPTDTSNEAVRVRLRADVESLKKELKRKDLSEASRAALQREIEINERKLNAP